MSVALGSACALRKGSSRRWRRAAGASVAVSLALALSLATTGVPAKADTVSHVTDIWGDISSIALNTKTDAAYVVASAGIQRINAAGPSDVKWLGDIPG